MIDYDDQVGWVRIDGFLPEVRAFAIRDACEAKLADLGTDLRVGDKPHSGTRRLVELVDRIPEVGPVVAQLSDVVTAVVGSGFRLSENSYRCPQSGFGGQKLHTDDVPRFEVGPNLCATAIVALVDFTSDNGATRVVPGSNLRPDLQRQAGQLESHPEEIRLTGPAGTAFVFTGHLLHSGMPNESDLPRPALQFTFRASGA